MAEAGLVPVGHPARLGPRPAGARGRLLSYTRWPTAKARFGQRVNANTHKPIRFTSGTKARIVHHRLRPARCRIFATGTATMMINRSGIPRGITQCHSGGIALQNQNWSQKNSIFSTPRSCDLWWPCTTKPAALPAFAKSWRREWSDDLSPSVPPGVRGRLRLDQFAFPRNALIRFVCTFDAVLELAPIVWELFGHFIDPTRH